MSTNENKIRNDNMDSAIEHRSFQIIGFLQTGWEMQRISFELESRHQVKLKAFYPVGCVSSLLKDGAEFQERMG